MKIRLVISGRSYHVAERIPEHFTLPEGASIDDALNAVDKLVEDTHPLPRTCLLAVSGTHLGTLGEHREHELSDGDELVLIAPVAGG